MRDLCFAHCLLLTQLLLACLTESATEGDSFILAFHTPASALAFAESFQLGLMNIAWPEELLDNPLAEAVWMKVGCGMILYPLWAPSLQ